MTLTNFMKAKIIEIEKKQDNKTVLELFKKYNIKIGMKAGEKEFVFEEMDEFFKAVGVLEYSKIEYNLDA